MNGYLKIKKYGTKYFIETDILDIDKCSLEGVDDEICSVVSPDFSTLKFKGNDENVFFIIDDNFVEKIPYLDVKNDKFVLRNTFGTINESISVMLIVDGITMIFKKNINYIEPPILPPINPPIYTFFHTSPMIISEVEYFPPILDMLLVNPNDDVLYGNLIESVV